MNDFVCWRRTITGVLASFLVIVLSGCGGGGNDQSTTPEDSGGGGNEQPAAPTGTGDDSNDQPPIPGESSAGGNEQPEPVEDNSGGANEQPTAPVDTSAPTVIYASPTSTETGVPRSAVVSAFFSEELLASSVSSESFSLRGDIPVQGTVSFDSSTNEATFTPNTPLGILTSYTVTLSTDISDLAGNALASVSSWGFTTADGRLSTNAETVQGPAASSYMTRPHVVYHDNGDAIAAWSREDKIWVNHYRAGSGWGAPSPLDLVAPSNTETNGRELWLTSDDSGNAMIAWSEHKTDIWADIFSAISRRILTGIFTGSWTDFWTDLRDDVWADLRTDIWVSYYDQSSGSWSTPVTLNTPGVSRAPRLAMDSNGNAMALWVEGLGNIWARNFSLESGWTDAVKIESDPGFVHGHQLVFDGYGNAIVTWAEFDGTNKVYANRFDSGSGWDTPFLLSEDIGLRAGTPRLAADASGNAIAIWTKREGLRYNLWYSYYDTVNGWGSAAPLEEHDESVKVAQLAMSTNGSAIVTWFRSDRDLAGTWSSRRYIPGEGWGNQEDLGSSYRDSCFCSYMNWDLDLEIDNNGNALFFWEHDDGTDTTIRFNRYTTANGWGQSTELAPTEANDDGQWSLAGAVNENGEVMVVYSDSSSSEAQIWSRQFK
ncbi:hypothetical protein Maes01_00065 [Microbulbifer aestuariivivens]|uniref:SbsA Ig-like domain-containing protein n=1 Tax=Microbulbifer aestuariivivens TaxID=1908308 RepID=A0ABP9WJX9_9GAMM